MPFRFAISTLEFSDGGKVELEPGSVLVLVGPNSAGKSTALREIAQQAPAPVIRGLVVRATETAKEGSDEEFCEWIKSNYPKSVVGGNEVIWTTGAQCGSASEQLIQLWRNPQNAAAFFVAGLSTHDRLTLANFTQSIPVYETPPQRPIHVLQRSRELEINISDEVRRSFGVDLIINWIAGPNVGFHVGTRPPGANPVALEYAVELQKLPKLDVDGDGIRSFVGALLAVKCGAQPILLIDEPEAFLHPTQARRLAEIIAQTAAQLNRQVILATHSADTIQGALVGSTKVAVCRLTRTGDKNHAALLESSRLKSLWSKPLLRASATIEGLFHAGTVICEAHSDSQFYSAVLRRMSTDGNFDRTPDLHFVQGGGKGELSTIARAYSGLHTRPAVIADIDILRKRPEFANLLEAVGERFESFEADYNDVASALGGLEKEVKPDQFVQVLGALSKQVSSENLISKNVRRELQMLWRNTSDWSEAKKYGLTKLSGATHSRAKIFFDRLAALGIFIVPVGELEGWWREGPPDKSDWAIAAIKKIEEDPGPFEAAIRFITRVCSHFGRTYTATGP